MSRFAVAPLDGPYKPDDPRFDTHIAAMQAEELPEDFHDKTLGCWDRNGVVGDCLVAIRWQVNWYEVL